MLVFKSLNQFEFNYRSLSNASIRHWSRGDWGGCEMDDDDDFDEPSAWRDNMALGDGDASGVLVSWSLSPPVS